MFEEPFLAKGPCLRQPIMGFMNGAVKDAIVEETLDVVEIDHFAWDEVARDPDIFRMGEICPQIKIG